MKKRLSALIIFFICFYLLNPFNYDFVFGYMLILIIFTQKELLKNIDATGIILVTFSFAYTIFYCLNPELGLQVILLYAFLPISFYLAGKQLMSSYQNQSKLFSILLFFGFILSLSSLLSVLLDIFLKGFVTIKRDVVNIWTGELENATNMGAKFVLNMCIPAILIVNFKKIERFWVKILMILIFIVSITCIMRLGSRTHIGITLLTSVFAFLYLLRIQSVKKNFVLILILFFVVNICFSYFSFDTDSDLLSAYADRMDSKSHGADTAGGRTERWEKSIQYLFKKPLGWDLDEFGFAHNLWLDTLRVGGIISFGLLLMLTTKVIRSCLKLLRKKFMNILEVQLLIYLGALLLLFFVEPILEGYFVVFCLFWFITGFLIKRLNKLV